MSCTILASSIPAKGKILKLISEVQQMDWKPIDQEIADDERCEEFEDRKNIIEDMTERIELYVETLVDINNKWLDFLQKILRERQRKEEKKYTEVIEDEQGVLNLINEGKEALIVLAKYKKNAEAEIECIRSKQGELLNQADQKEINTCGDPRKWRELWSNFEAAVHKQDLPDMQKLS
ncbi:unnamed protein product [Onchocerca ochengi]|uniref:Uncharacterized protein n=1 Tax=Onchocerca ochengi TaxID=42157 RepID=A0A182EWU6_ONCOC|nr:unnamed protein product [Onchocerca ochengi]